MNLDVSYNRSLDKFTVSCRAFSIDFTNKEFKEFMEKVSDAVTERMVSQRERLDKLLFGVLEDGESHGISELYNEGFSHSFQPPEVTRIVSSLLDAGLIVQEYDHAHGISYRRS